MTPLRNAQRKMPKRIPQEKFAEDSLENTIENFSKTSGEFFKGKLMPSGFNSKTSRDFSSLCLMDWCLSFNF